MFLRRKMAIVCSGRHRTKARKVQLTSLVFVVKHMVHENVSFSPFVGIHPGALCACRRGRYEDCQFIERGRQNPRASQSPQKAPKEPQSPQETREQSETRREGLGGVSDIPAAFLPRNRFFSTPRCPEPLLWRRSSWS